MLHIESVIHDFVSALGPTIAALESKNRQLADQLDRATSSILLNTAEGRYSTKGNKSARYSSALGSAGEARACLQLARARYGIESARRPGIASTTSSRSCGDSRTRSDAAVL